MDTFMTLSEAVSHVGWKHLRAKRSTKTIVILPPYQLELFMDQLHEFFDGNLPLTRGLPYTGY